MTLYRQPSPFEILDFAFEFAKKFTEEVENIERRNRNDDNMAKFTIQATRLYEQGKITKEQLLTIISNLPDNRLAINVSPSHDMAKPKPTVDDLLSIISKM